MNEITARCVACRKRFTMTDAQIAEANAVGCAISPCCNFPSTVEKVVAKRRTAKAESRGGE